MIPEKSYLRKKPVKADPNLEPRIRTRIQTKNSNVTSCYLHFVYDPKTKKRINRSISFGIKRTKKEAYILIKKWRKDILKKIHSGE